MLKVIKLSEVVMVQRAQVITLLLVFVTGEDLHEFLGLNVPFFSRDSGRLMVVHFVTIDKIFHFSNNAGKIVNKKDVSSTRKCSPHPEIQM